MFPECWNAEVTKKKARGKFFLADGTMYRQFLYILSPTFSKYTDKSKRSLNLLFHQLMISLLGRNIPSNNFAIHENSGDLDLGIDYRCLECSGTDLHRFSERLIT